MKEYGRGLIKYLFKEEITTGGIGIRDVHDNIMYYLIIIISLVVYIIFKSINTYKVRYISENTLLEIIWTIVPGIILIIIGIPSFKLLYKLDEIYNPYITLHIKGNQWFWTYKIADLGIEFDSYTKEDIEQGEIRLLSTDKPLILPILTPIRLLLTSEDVIHSFTIPNIGIKLDTNPGRINTTILTLLKKGVYYGQCSELCGILHSKMAIELIGTSYKKYIIWCISNKNIRYSLFSNIVTFFK